MGLYMQNAHWCGLYTGRKYLVTLTEFLCGHLFLSLFIIRAFESGQSHEQVLKIIKRHIMPPWEFEVDVKVNIGGRDACFYYASSNKAHISRLAVSSGPQVTEEMLMSLGSPWLLGLQIEFITKANLGEAFPNLKEFEMICDGGASEGDCIGVLNKLPPTINEIGINNFNNEERDLFCNSTIWRDLCKRYVNVHSIYFNIRIDCHYVPSLMHQLGRIMKAPTMMIAITDWVDLLSFLTVDWPGLGAVSKFWETV